MVCVSAWNKQWPEAYERITGKRPSEDCITDFWKFVANPYVKLIIQDIKNRFQASDVVGALGIFDPKGLPTDVEKLASHGVKELYTILEHFAPAPVKHNAQGTWCTA